MKQRPRLRRFFLACLSVLLTGVAMEARALEGTVLTPVTFVGPVTGRSISFSLYLPPGYEGGSERYPVVFHLHGLTGVHNNRNQLSVISQSYEQAFSAGRIGRVIIVFPDGDHDSFWSDSRDGQRPIETHVVREILPYVDATYRTLASRTQRAIQGFSMGGFGAAKLAAKFPDLFCASVIYDGALVTWPIVQQRHPTIAASMFGNDAAYFDQHSPWFWVAENGPTLSRDVPFRQVVASLVLNNQSFRTHLLSFGIASEYVETGCDHSLSCVVTSGGADSWSFIADSFGDVTTPTPTPTPTPVPTKQATFVSIGAEDGWVLESRENSGAGGTEQASWLGSSALIAGDDAADRQFKALVSFDTSSLPDDATILSATLRLRRGTVSGTNPFATHGPCAVDVRTGGFGGGAALEATDFEAPATVANAGTLGNAPASGEVSEAALNASGRAAIHKRGRTQMRLSFAVGDNDDGAGDFMGWHSGESAVLENRPRLIVVYR